MKDKKINQDEVARHLGSSVMITVDQNLDWPLSWMGLSNFLESRLNSKWWYHKTMNIARANHDVDAKFSRMGRSPLFKSESGPMIQWIPGETPERLMIPTFSQEALK